MKKWMTLTLAITIITLSYSQISVAVDEPDSVKKLNKLISTEAKMILKMVHPKATFISAEYQEHAAPLIKRKDGTTVPATSVPYAYRVNYLFSYRTPDGEKESFSLRCYIKKDGEIDRVFATRTNYKYLEPFANPSFAVSLAKRYSDDYLKWSTAEVKKMIDHDDAKGILIHYLKWKQ